MLLSKMRKSLEVIAKVLAITGGFFLLAVAVVTLVSIVGRAFIFAGLRPVKGDFELVEISCAIAVFYFLPICQLAHGNVAVDLFSNKYPAWLRRIQVFLADFAFAIVGVVIARQLWFGLLEKISYQETTFILGLPVWYGYALCLIGAVMFAITAIFTAIEAFSAVIAGNQRQGIVE